MGGAKVRTRFQETRDGTSLVVAAVLGKATFDRLCRSGVGLLGRRHEVDAFEEARPDAFCGRCSGWGISPRTASPLPTGVPSARRTSPQRTTGAQLRGTEWGEAACDRTGQPGAPTAGAPMASGRMRARPRGCPGSQLGSGGALPPPRRGRRGARPSDAPDAEATAAQVEEVSGETGAEEMEEEDQPRLGRCDVFCCKTGDWSRRLSFDTVQQHGRAEGK